jgi:hypothetical protein
MTGDGYKNRKIWRRRETALLNTHVEYAWIFAVDAGWHTA